MQASGLLPGMDREEQVPLAHVVMLMSNICSSEIASLLLKSIHKPFDCGDDSARPVNEQAPGRTQAPGAECRFFGDGITSVTDEAAVAA